MSSWSRSPSPWVLRCVCACPTLAHPGQTVCKYQPCAIPSVPYGTQPPLLARLLFAGNPPPGIPQPAGVVPDSSHPDACRLSSRVPSWWTHSRMQGAGQIPGHRSDPADACILSTQDSWPLPTGAASRDGDLRTWPPDVMDAMGGLLIAVSFLFVLFPSLSFCTAASCFAFVYIICHVLRGKLAHASAESHLP